MNEKLEIPDGHLLFKSVNAIKNGCVRVAQMPKYSEPKLSTNEANSASWHEFKDAMQPFACKLSRDNETEFAFTHKSTPWTVEDVNLWTGSNIKTIDQIPDFSLTALTDLFRLHTEIAIKLQRDGKASQWGFGFNPQDFSPGHHSVKRFHTHIRGLDNPHDRQNIVIKPWQSSNWFERLTAIEPFTPVAADILSNLLKLPDIQSLGWSSQSINKSGYISYEAEPISDYNSYARAFKKLYEGGALAYEAISTIFTDCAVDPRTDKYIPLPQQERFIRYHKFARTNYLGLSESSLELLRYLACNIQYALPRVDNGNVRIGKSSQVHITKGFAGGFMFSTKSDGRTSIDFFPRVITTTGPTKNLHADGEFYGFTKTQDQPVSIMRQENTAFAKKITLIVHNIDL